MRFAFSPPPIEDELLSSWVHRVAVGHAVSAWEFLHVAGGDLDWRPPGERLLWLARGSAQPIRRLAAMTLSEVCPVAERSWFAWSDNPFPGCHAYCPLCARDDYATRGAVIQRAANAGLWAAACAQHHCLLDGVERLGDVVPRKRRRPRQLSWENGIIAPGSEVHAAPEFLIDFQATAGQAQHGVAPDRRWLVNDPNLFLAAARTLADLILRVTPVNHFARTSGLDQLVGHKWSVSSLGTDSWRSDQIDRLAARARVRTLAGVALLLMAPDAWAPTTFTAWFLTRGYQDPGPCRPWRRVTQAWGPEELAHAFEAVRGWPAAILEEAGRGLASRQALLEKRGYSFGVGP